MTKQKTAAMLSTLVAAAMALPRMPSAQTQPAAMDIADAPIPMRVLEQSPAQTDTDLHVICLFSSSPENTLHGSLVEVNEKLKGLLDRIRRASLFRGELGETLLLTPPRGSLGARKLLIIGLGDAETFSPARMQLVGEIVYAEASRLGVSHPFFAPTILDGGLTKFTTGQIAEQVVRGFLRAMEIDQAIQGNAAAGHGMALTYLAGPRYASNTRQGMETAISMRGEPQQH
jgi:hypothetical protein